MDEKSKVLYEQLLSAIDNQYDKTEGYIVSDLLKSVAIVLSQISNDLIKTQETMDVNNLSGAILEKFIEQRKGITRYLATFSKGAVTVTGNGQIAIGDLFETQSGIQFSATENKTIINTGVVKVVCVTSGSIGNLPSNQIVLMPVTLAGITSVTNTSPTTDGFDAETDESLRDRYYTSLRTPSTSGNKWHYLQWAKEASAGVSDAKVFPLARGDNTVEVVIIDQDKQPASAALIEIVQNYIDPNSSGLGNGQAPIGAKCYVVTATPLTINISVTVNKAIGYTNEVIQTNISNMVSNYFKEIAFENPYVSYAKIGEAILNSDGVNDYSNLLVNSGTANIDIGEKQIPIIGGVTVV